MFHRFKSPSERMFDKFREIILIDDLHVRKSKLESFKTEHSKELRGDEWQSKINFQLALIERKLNEKNKEINNEIGDEDELTSSSDDSNEALQFNME